jgi:hypothetical protein
MHLSRVILRPLLCLSITLSLTSLIANSAEAATVTQVKGKQVLIDLSNSSVGVKEGATYFVVVDGRRLAAVKIVKIQGTRAVGQVVKGNAKAGGQLQAAGRGSGGGKSADSKRGSPRAAAPKKTSPDGMFFGVLGGLNTTSQTIKPEQGSAFTTSGMGYSVKAFGELPVMGAIGLIGRFGLEQLNMKGTVSADAATNAGASAATAITYMTGDLLLRYRFLDGSFAPFAASGLGVMIPVSKKSENALQVNDISAITVFYLAGGFNFMLSQNSYLTASAEYGLFPPSTTVSTTMIMFRGGMGFRF